MCGSEFKVDGEEKRSEEGSDVALFVFRYRCEPEIELDEEEIAMPGLAVDLCFSSLPGSNNARVF